MNHIIVEGLKTYPSKVICIGRNYVDHINELNNEIPDEMVVFAKPNSAISPMLNSFHQEDLHYETELCVVYEQGRLSGVGLGLDLTKRGLQSRLKAKGLPWERAKSFDGAAVLTPFLKIPESSEQLSFSLHIDGKLIQHGHFDLMMYKPQEILLELQSFMTLEDGDVIMTGTPKGVGTICQGNMFELCLYDGKLQLLRHELIAQ